MFAYEMRLAVAICSALLISGTPASPRPAAYASQAAATSVRLAEVARDLPAYIQPSRQSAYMDAIEGASRSDRDDAIPTVVAWLSDRRPQVRALSLLTLNLLYLPGDKRPGRPFSEALPVTYLPTVASRLRDPDLAVRRATFGALQSTENSGIGMDQLVELVLPMLRDPGVLNEPPDPFFTKSEQERVATMPPPERAQYEATPHKVIRLPAEGPLLVEILLASRHPSNSSDDALIRFIDRDDQTKSTLGETLHILALRQASERVDNEALRRVLEQKAMTVFLLQFVTSLRLTPEHQMEQRTRLLALSNDAFASAALRRSAATVAACWRRAFKGLCRPDDRDLNQE